MPAMKSAEVVVWDDRFPADLCQMTWPGFQKCYIRLNQELRNEGAVLGLLSPLGFRLKAVSRYRSGFLWLTVSHQYFLEREVTWTPTQKGIKDDFTHTRSPVALEEQLLEAQVQLWKVEGQ